MGITNLYSVWASVGVQFVGRATIPIDYVQFGQLGDDLLNVRNKEFPKDNGEDIDFEEWAAESFSLAKTKVYPGFEQGDLNPDYRNTVMTTAGE
jgi:hypothetical protein